MACFDRIRINNSIVREFLSEFIATFIFILMGEASMAHLIFKKEHDIFAVVFCWGIAVMFGLLTGAANSGGHINPIVTTSLAAVGKFPWKKVPHYILGQHLGSFAACGLLYAQYYEFLNAYDGGERIISGDKGTGIMWTTYPSSEVSMWTCTLDTIICSGMLMFGIMVVLDKKNANIPGYLHAFFIGLLVMAICWAFGSNCMAGINPARDFPPRVLSALIGYGGETFGFQTFWVIPMFVTHLGGLIGTVLYEAAISAHIPERRAPIAEIRELKDYQASA